MLIIICGQKNSGKSVALEILKENGYTVFNTDFWIHEIYRNGNIGYDLIANKIGPEFVNKNEVDRKKLKQWIIESETKIENGKKINYNLNLLNSCTLPLIKKKMVELYKNHQLIFVELAIYLNHKEFFRDITDEVIYIERPNNIPLEGTLESYLKDKPRQGWFTVKNDSTISDYKINLLKTVDLILNKQMNKRMHIYSENEL